MSCFAWFIDLYVNFFLSEQGSTLITLKGHHGGLISYTPHPHYEGGDVCVIDYLESIGLSIFEIDRLTKAGEVYGHKV